MLFIKNQNSVRSGLLLLALSLSPAFSPLFSDSGAGALAQTSHSTKKSVSRSNAHDKESDSELPPEITALWRNPSETFTSTFAHVGEEPREVSIDKIRRFLGGGGGAPFGINLGALSGNQSEKQAAAYALARLLTKGKNNNPTAEERQEAISLFEKSATFKYLHMPSLWHEEECMAAMGDENAIRAMLARLSDDPAASEQDQARAQYELAQSYMRTGGNPVNAGDSAAGDQSATATATTLSPDALKARAIFSEIREKFPSSEYAKGSSYYLAQMAMTEAGGNATPQAVALLREYLKSGTGGRFSSDVANKLVALSQSTSTAPVQLSADDLEQIASVYYKKGDLTKALAIYDRLGPDAKLFQRAQCYSKTGRKAEAIAALLAAIKQDPASTTYDDYASTICGPLTKAEATDLWRKILALNPKHADHALYNIATRVDEDEALPLLAKLLNQFPTSEHAPESLWWVFWYQTKKIYPANVVKEKEKTMAMIKLADQGLVRYPQHRVAARLAFWAGKLYEKMGAVEEAKHQYELARDKYPTNYYGARARARLQYMLASGDKKHDRAFSTSASRQLAPDTWNWPQPPHLFSFDRVAPLVGAPAMVLAVTHQADEALARIDSSAAAKAESGEDHETVDCLRGWLYLGQGMPIEGIRAAGKDLNGHPTKCPRWQILYPWAYAAAINDAAHKNNVDPYLVHALIREESRYFPMALSRSKAIGLMQLMPGTAFGVAKRIGLPLSSKEEVFIPDNNIKMGTNYLAYTLSRFDGQAMLAVASYNGGPNAVKSWVDQFHAHGGTDWDIFVENIPFRETRDYVRKVFGSYWTYELIYQ